MTGEIPAIKEFPNDGKTWRIEWFNGIERDQNLPSEPKAQLVISPSLYRSEDTSTTSRERMLFPTG